MNRVAPYAVDVIDATPREVDAVTRAVAATYDAPVVVTYRTQHGPRVSDRVVRNRLITAGVVLALSALIGLNGPLWAAMPWSVTP